MLLGIAISQNINVTEAWTTQINQLVIDSN